MTTLAPSRARRRAVALPMPLEAPVMRATFPARDMVVMFVGDAVGEWLSWGTWIVVAVAVVLLNGTYWPPPQEVEVNEVG